MPSGENGGELESNFQCAVFRVVALEPWLLWLHYNEKNVIVSLLFVLPCFALTVVPHSSSRTFAYLFPIATHAYTIVNCFVFSSSLALLRCARCRPNQRKQSFIWPLARPATADETIIVELRTQTTRILMKTGFASASTSRGTITSSSKIVGRYEMLMQGKRLPTICMCMH